MIARNVGTVLLSYGDMSRVTQLGDRLYMIDAFMFDDAERLSCYYYDTPEPVLVECGPTRSLHHLLESLDELGVTDVATIVVTHIHLDHAGGAGAFAAHFPNSRVGVHRVGAPHLSNPARLIASATRIYGEDGMEAMWGDMVPVPEGRLRVLDEGDRVPLGGGEHLEVMYTPGHAKHHVVFFDPVRGGMYVGDAVGITFPHGHMLPPNTPPPDFDLPVLIEQLNRMAERDPSWLGFAHYGTDERPQDTLQLAKQRLRSWVDFVANNDASWQDLRRWVLDGYRADGHDEATIAVYDKNTFWPMMVTGIERWLDVGNR